MAKEYLDRIECPHVLVVPGNHDSRNVGYVHFEKLFGPRGVVLHTGDISIVGVDSTEPDLDYGTIGRSRYAWLEEQFAAAGRASASSCCTTTCCRSRAPGASATWSTTPATRSRCCSAATSTSCCPATSTCRTPGTSRTCSWSTPAPCCTLRLRGDTRPCYNIVTIDDDHVRVERKYPFHGSETIIEFSPSTASVREECRSVRAACEGEGTIGARCRRAVARDRRRALPAGRGSTRCAAGGRLRVRRARSFWAAARSCAGSRRARTARRALRPAVAAARGAAQARAALRAGVREALRAARRRVVVDVSDEPVLGYLERFQLISVALSWGARYVGADFEFSPQPLARLSSKPSLAIIGTGKRVGKTAVSGMFGRRLQARSARPGGDRGDGARGTGRSAGRLRRATARRRAAARGVAAGVARRVRLSRGRGAHGRDHGRVPALRRRHGRGLGGRHGRRGAAARRRHAGRPCVMEGSGSAMPPVAGDAIAVRGLGHAAARVHNGVSGYVSNAHLRRTLPHHV